MPINRLELSKNWLIKLAKKEIAKKLFIHAPEFEEVEGVWGEAVDARIDEVHDGIVPEGDDGGGVDDALVHLAIETVADRVDGLLEGSFVEFVEDGIAITGIVRRRRVFAVEVAEIVFRIWVVGDPAAAEEEGL